MFNLINAFATNLCIDCTVPNIANAMESVDSDSIVPEDTQITITCENGYMLEDGTSNVVNLTCQDTGEWVPNPPQCIGMVS